MQLVERLKIKVPVIMAPMAGVSTPKLVASVCNAGAFGFHGAAFRNANDLANDIKEIQSKTSQPFGINLFATKPVQITPKEEMRIENAKNALKPFYLKAGLEENDIPSTPKENHLLKEQLEVIKEHGDKIACLSFCFGVLEQETIKELQNLGIIIMGTATSVEEAIVLEKHGVDGIIAQGAEAGGHRGSFLESSSLVGTMSLVPQIVDHTSVPVVAAGGIMDGRGVAAALCLGAQAAALGTAFLVKHESEASDLHKKSILEAKETDTVVSDVYSGRSARGLANELSLDYQKISNNKHRVMNQQENIAPYPLQQSLNGPLKSKSLKEGNNQLMSLWSGQGVRMAKSNSVSEFMDEIEQDLKKIL